MVTASATNRRSLFIGVIIAYLLLWLLTATWGTSTVDQKFDRELALGYPGFSTNPAPVVRIPYKREMQLRDPPDPPAELWRARSSGVAIAPFVILDAAAWIDGGVSGFSGFRLNLWFFGISVSLPLKVFWVS